MFNWFKKVSSTQEPSIEIEVNPKDKLLYDNITEYAKQIGIKDYMPLNQACWLILIEVKRIKIDLRNHIKLLEDNAFSDRAKIIELENKIEAQVKDYERRIELLQGNASLNTSHIMRLEDEVEELTNKIIRLECK